MVTLHIIKVLFSYLFAELFGFSTLKRQPLEYFMSLRLIYTGCLVAAGCLLNQTASAAEYVAAAGDKIWIADADLASKTCRGFIFASTYGAGEKVYSSADYRALATKHHFAIYLDNYEQSGGSSKTTFGAASVEWDWPLLDGVTTDLAYYGVSSLPCIRTGVSAEGWSLCYDLDRASAAPFSIAGVNYRGRFYDFYDNPVDADDVPAELGVPILSVMSYSDNKDDRTGTIEINLRDGARDYWNAPWTGLMQQTSAHNAIGDSYFATEWLDALITQRLPAGDFAEPDPTATTTIKWKVINPLNAPETGSTARGGKFTLGEEDTYFFENYSVTNTYVPAGTDTWLPNQHIADLWLASCSQFTVEATSSGFGNVDIPSQQVWGTEDGQSITAIPMANNTFIK